MKRGYKFYFQDEPQFSTTIFSRAYTANKFRAYRAHPERYTIKRTSSGYQVKMIQHSVVAIYERF